MNACMDSSNFQISGIRSAQRCSCADTWLSTNPDISASYLMPLTTSDGGRAAAGASELAKSASSCIVSSASGEGALAFSSQMPPNFRNCSSTSLASLSCPERSDHPWLQCVLVSSQHLPAPLPPTVLANRCKRDSLRLQTSSAWQAALAPYPAPRKRLGPGATAWPCASHTDQPSWALPLHALFSMAPPALLPCCGVLFPLCPFWQAPLLPLCGLGFHSPAWFVSRAELLGPHHVPTPGTAGGYTLPERHWRCVQHYLFNCKASPLGCPDSADVWADLRDLLLPTAPARSRVHLALHVDSFDASSVRALRALAPGSFLLPAGMFPAPAVTLCALFLPPLVSWLRLLLRMPRCQWVRLCSLLGSCVVL
jgi:hypothetical protein